MPKQHNSQPLGRANPKTKKRNPYGGDLTPFPDQVYSKVSQRSSTSAAATVRIDPYEWVRRITARRSFTWARRIGALSDEIYLGTLPKAPRGVQMVVTVARRAWPDAQVYLTGRKRSAVPSRAAHDEDEQNIVAAVSLSLEDFRRCEIPRGREPGKHYDIVKFMMQAWVNALDEALLHKTRILLPLEIIPVSRVFKRLPALKKMEDSEKEGVDVVGQGYFELYPHLTKKDRLLFGEFLKTGDSGEWINYQETLWGKKPCPPWVLPTPLV
ncbi:hypothetical protein FA15DRAFT_757796 [Coprinopsis marcescibilis]|uniref:Uncharacterized protein n=1 Tax=Coprinopsis marcescibilis TaxID=230819 RepID=A0A5C3KR31_COPMA|nr:hypothetical protein FA15DRAFT_757796 [Coprinopsis marcescibilis]